MPTRILIAYVLIAALIAALFAGALILHRKRKIEIEIRRGRRKRR